jgi:hypothetical protein
MKKRILKLVVGRKSTGLGISGPIPNVFSNSLLGTGILNELGVKNGLAKKNWCGPSAKQWYVDPLGLPLRGDNRKSNGSKGRLSSS